MNEEQFLKEHPGLSDAIWNNFPIFRKLIHETQLDKEKVREVIDKYYKYFNSVLKYQELKKELGLDNKGSG